MRDTTLIIVSAVFSAFAFVMLEETPKTASEVPVETWLLVDELTETETQPSPDETRTLFLLIDVPVETE